MKNKYLILFLTLSLLKATTGFCTSHLIQSGGTFPHFTFIPDSVSADVGDTIDFQIASFHFPKEVDSANWAINDSTSNGGFVLPLGGGIYVINQVKTYYYVCGVHFAEGMKGRIFVTNPNGINALINTPANLEIFPNPVSTNATIKTSLPSGKENQIRIFDLTGKCLYQKDNVSSIQYLDLSGFSSGIYFVAIKSDDVYLERKLIVSK
jgi:plastocyanin